MPDTPDDPTRSGHWSAGDSDGASAFYREFLGCEQAGGEIGPYRLVSLLGEGGFGTVWKAERRHPFKQTVALKLLHAASRDIIARFEQERQVLASLNHPCIAKVLEGGVTPAGRPYSAMEFVEGLPINRYCDENRLSIKDRLRLFIQLCEAVEHAHQSGIIHRDLKPGNVLVARGIDHGPHVKVIDFGIDKALGGGMTEKTLHTLPGRPMGTPDYMSPEQVLPDATRIDKRTDVYSLGVMLYELLVGSLPFEPLELRDRAEDEMKRIIRDEDPPRPSVRLSSVGSADARRIAEIERSRGVRMAELVRQLRSELEWIPLMAMRKERERRYASCMVLARDISLYLEGAPLQAAPDSLAYRARKSLRRHRMQVISFGLVVAALGIGAWIPMAVAEIAERRHAERMREFEWVNASPDPKVVLDPEARSRIEATGRPWMMRHRASGIVMLLVPRGEFMMGSAPGEDGHRTDERQHARVIARAFYLSQNEVSKREWKTIAGSDVGYFSDPELPVESVSWLQVRREFLEPTRRALRLPTEAEGEYACRAGTTTCYAYGDAIDRDRVRHEGKRPVACGSLPPNPWGFCEMHGNVLEWVEERYTAYPEGGASVATIPGIESGDLIFRGGAWNGRAGDCWSARRDHDAPGFAGMTLGFRVAADLETPIVR